MKGILLNPTHCFRAPRRFTRLLWVYFVLGGVLAQGQIPVIGFYPSPALLKGVVSLFLLTTPITVRGVLLIPPQTIVISSKRSIYECSYYLPTCPCLDCFSDYPLPVFQIFGVMASRTTVAKAAQEANSCSTDLNAKYWPVRIDKGITAFFFKSGNNALPDLFRGSIWLLPTRAVFLKDVMSACIANPSFPVTSGNVALHLSASIKPLVFVMPKEMVMGQSTIEESMRARSSNLY